MNGRDYIGTDYCVIAIHYTLHYLRSSHTAAMVTYSVTKMITTCSPVIGQFFDTMIVASSDK